MLQMLAGFCSTGELKALMLSAQCVDRSILALPFLVFLDLHAVSKVISTLFSKSLQIPESCLLFEKPCGRERRQHYATRVMLKCVNTLGRQRFQVAADYRLFLMPLELVTRSLPNDVLMGFSFASGRFV